MDQIWFNSSKDYPLLQTVTRLIRVVTCGVLLAGCVNNSEVSTGAGQGNIGVAEERVVRSGMMVNLLGLPPGAVSEGLTLKLRMETAITNPDRVAFIVNGQVFNQNGVKYTVSATDAKLGVLVVRVYVEDTRSGQKGHTDVSRRVKSKVRPISGDEDGDGVVDDLDDCPNRAGPASNDGCPVDVSPPPVNHPTLFNLISVPHPSFPSFLGLGGSVSDADGIDEVVVISSGVVDLRLAGGGATTVTLPTPTVYYGSSAVIVVKVVDSYGVVEKYKYIL